MNCAIINRAAEQRGGHQLRKGVPEEWIEWVVSASKSSGGVTTYAGFMTSAASHIPSADRILVGVALMLGFCVTAPLLDVTAQLMGFASRS